MSTLTKQNVQAMTKDRQVIRAAETVFLAMAYEQSVRELIEPAQQEIINAYKFEIAPKYQEREPDKDKRIKKADHMYLANDDDFYLYLKEKHKKHKELGFNVGFDYCPLLIAENQTMDAKHHLIKLLEPYTGITLEELVSTKLQYYYKYIELNLTLLSEFVDTEKAKQFINTEK